MIIHGREREVVRLTAAMLQQGWRGAACHVSQSACLAGVQAQEIGLVACAGKHWRQRLQACSCWCMMRQTCCLVEPARHLVAACACTLHRVSSGLDSFVLFHWLSPNLSLHVQPASR